MQQQDSAPKIKHLVLLGGGHSHLSVLMQFAKNPLPGLAITLISRDIETPYSGSLPANIRGDITDEQMHIDLRPLAQMAGVRIIRANVDRIDAANKVIFCAGRPNIPFDILSINIGSSPASAAIVGANDFALPVKPISNFIVEWRGIIARAKAANSNGQAHHIAIVGGGPASVELALAMHTRLLRELDLTANNTLAPKITLICRSAALLADHCAGAQTAVTKALNERGIQVLLHTTAHKICADKVEYHNKQAPNTILSLHTNEIILATGSSAPTWLQETGIDLTESGFVRVGESLQSFSHPWIFAAGDIASIEKHPRPKSGVYAVRQGQPLAENLRRYAANSKLKRHVPQKYALALISVNASNAIASRKQWSFQGRWVAMWKNWIDRRFIAKYQNIPAPKETKENSIALSQRPGLKKRQAVIRCSGCGAKVGADALRNVLSQLSPCTHSDILSQHPETEDASIIQIDEKRLLLQSVDHFRAFISDPYVFAKVATVHCLSDVHAMGATAHSALAIVSVPYGSDKIMQASLLELMSAATQVLNEHDTALIGGHSSEAGELSFGLSINAFADPAKILRKSTALPGHALILCKPLGTGTLFAADMRYQAKQRWIEAALTQMQISNQMASHCFVKFGASACTDITGFGLIGHLREMLEPKSLSATLRLDAIPLIDGALETIKKGYVSSLHEENLSNAAPVGLDQMQLEDSRAQLLFDPQTAGGLLAAIPKDNVDACMKELRAAGYAFAACIGELDVASSTGGARISLSSAQATS
jgi:selenide,water dikinase